MRLCWYLGQVEIQTTVYVRRVSYCTVAAIGSFIGLQSSAAMAKESAGAAAADAQQLLPPKDSDVVRVAQFTQDSAAGFIASRVKIREITRPALRLISNQRLPASANVNVKSTIVGVFPIL